MRGFGRRTNRGLAALALVGGFVKIRRWETVAACVAGLSAIGVMTPSPAGAALHPIPGTYTIHEIVSVQGWTSVSATLSANHSASIVGSPAVGTWKLTTLSTGAEKITITFGIANPAITLRYRAKVTAAGFASLAHPGTYTIDPAGTSGIWYATLG